jgi:hypothetical protein
VRALRAASSPADRGGPDRAGSAQAPKLANACALVVVHTEHRRQSREDEHLADDDLSLLVLTFA